MGRKINRALTPKQKDILDFVTQFCQEKGYSPSLGEVGTEFNLATSTVHQHLKSLGRKGYLKREDNQPRGVSVLEESLDSMEIPLMGLIAAGSPIEPIENPEPIKVPKSMVSKRGDYYALKVKGDSMIEDGILDGDTVVIKSQPTAEDGETIVAITEDGATLKRFRNQNGTPVLEPRNTNYEIIKPKKLEIRGKFVGLIRTE